MNTSGYEKERQQYSYNDRDSLILLELEKFEDNSWKFIGGH